MRRILVPLLPLLALPLLVAHVASGCSSSSGDATTSGTTASGTGGSVGGAGGTGGTGGSGPDPSAICATLGLPVREFSEGPYGTHRGDVAEDFTLDLADGTSWNLHTNFSGCDSYVFVPDKIAVSELDPTSVWEKDADVKTLVKNSPKNVHYFFISREGSTAAADTSIQGMKARLEGVIAGLSAEDAAHWKDRLHVVSQKATALGNWIGDVATSHGKIGFSIDRMQRIRGAGYLADVKRYSSELESAGAWPWKSNIAYVAHYPAYFNAQAKVQEHLDTDGATVVKLWDGEILQEYADITIALPSAAEMAGFDTLEIEVTQQCPDPDLVEVGNCGAWDYIASFQVEDASANLVEIARAITSYHRETHWVIDASDMLPLLKDGGMRHFRWSFAPEWNVQPTATKLHLRFSNQNKGMKPTQATFLWSGGGFGSAYNMSHAPIDVPIPATAKKVELFAITTGHGANTNQCAEFCNHQHEFSVNGVPHLQQFPEAQKNDGCIAHLENGMTPNQAGTWWFGRGGWCPGQQVDPWIVDVTADVVPGQTATIAYVGMFKNMDPPPDNSGDIDLVSYLVVHE